MNKKILVDYYYDEIVNHLTKDDIRLLVSHLVRLVVLSEFSDNLKSIMVYKCEKTHEK